MYRSTLLRFSLISVLFAVAFSMSGCGNDPIPPTPEELTLEGWEAYMDGDYEGAKERFEEAVTTTTGFVPAYVGLGWTHGKMANLQASIENFQNALLGEPGNVDALAGIAFAYLAGDDYEQAIANVDRALAIDPNYSFEHDNVTSQDLHMVLAESYYYKGDFDNAQRELGIECSSEENCAAELLEELIKLMNRSS